MCVGSTGPFFVLLMKSLYHAKIYHGIFLPQLKQKGGLSSAPRQGLPLFLPARGFALSTTSAPLPGTHVCPSRAAACVLLSLDLCHKILLSWQVLMVDNIPPD